MIDQQPIVVPPRKDILGSRVRRVSKHNEPDRYGTVMDAVNVPATPGYPKPYDCWKLLVRVEVPADRLVPETWFVHEDPSHDTAYEVHLLRSDVTAGETESYLSAGSSDLGRLLGLHASPNGGRP